MTKKKYAAEEEFRKIKQEMADKKEDYIPSRNKLCKIAEKFANLKTKDDKDHPDWNRIYFQHMDKLAFESGLQSARFHPDKKEK